MRPQAMLQSLKPNETHSRRDYPLGALAHPLVVFAACVLAGLLTLRFLHARPVRQLISVRFLAVGAVIGVACFFLGEWFGASLMHMP